jgi:predicted Rossmann fold nucleotide-binding protein DprA/Smf involved in DNA uptake
VICGSTHPLRPEVTCEREGDHADHAAYLGRELLTWENEEFYFCPTDAEMAQVAANIRARRLGIAPTEVKHHTITPTQRRILDALAFTAAMDEPTLAERANVSLSRIHAHCVKLEEAGLVNQRGEGWELRDRPVMKDLG